MAVGQMVDVGFSSWGDAPGYDKYGRWPKNQTSGWMLALLFNCALALEPVKADFEPLATYADHTESARCGSAA